MKKILGIILGLLLVLGGIGSAKADKIFMLSMGGPNWSDFQPAYIQVQDDFWMGLGAAKGRIEFDDQATDEINFLDAIVRIGADSGAGMLNITSLANEDGIVFGSLGTATKGIDLSGSGLSGGSDYWIYNDANNYWAADGTLIVAGGAPAGSSYITDLSTNSISVGDPTAIGSWGGDGVSNGTTTITDVGGAAHGLGLAAGDLVHITDSTTAADKGFYRIVSDDGTLVVVDRTLAGSDTDLAVTFYKDVIGIFATDGTNGQRIMNYSHQDKPLQIGGDTLVATSYSLGSEDVLFGAKIEFTNTIRVKDGIELLFGDTIQDHGGFRYVADDGLHFSPGNMNNKGNNNIIIVAANYANLDFDHDTLSADPTLIIHSALSPNTSNNQWGSFTHDREDFVISTGVNTGAGSAPTTDENGIKLFPRGGSNGLHIMGDGSTQHVEDPTHGGYITKIYSATTGTLPAATTDTIQLNIPTGWVIQGCQLHVKTALAGGDTWDAELNDGATEEAIATNQAVAQNTNVNHHASADAGYGGTLTDAETDILITKNGGGSFTAQGEIEATCIAKGFDAWDAE